LTYDGVIELESMIDDIKKPVEWGHPWCFDSLTVKTYGRYDGNILTFGAGSGVGKTSVLLQQAAYDIQRLGYKVGLIFLETPPVEMAKRIAGKIAETAFHLPDCKYDEALLDKTLEYLQDKVYIYENRLGSDWSVVKAKIRTMVKGFGVKMIYLDHLTAMADTDNERGSLEQIMKEMAEMATETGCIIHLVSHLSTPEGKPHEEGGRIMGKHFKGSRAIMFWSHFMFGLEGNVQSEADEDKVKRNFRVIKDRMSGRSTGFVLPLIYDHETGKLKESEGEW
jgi:twinkle protein